MPSVRSVKSIAFAENNPGMSETEAAFGHESEQNFPQRQEICSKQEGCSDKFSRSPNRMCIFSNAFSPSDLRTVLCSCTGRWLGGTESGSKGAEFRWVRIRLGGVVVGISYIFLKS